MRERVPRFVATALITIMAFGCSRFDLRVIAEDLPAELDRVGLVLLDEEGHLVAATGLMPKKSAGLYFGLGEGELEPASAALVVGYRDATLAPIRPPPPEGLEAQRLSLPQPVDGLLPTPDYFGAGDARASPLRVASSDAIQPLTATWRGTSCTTDLPEGVPLDVELACAPCERATAIKRGCSIEIEALAPGALAIDGAGRPQGQCTSSNDVPPRALASYACAPPFIGLGGACELNLYPQVTLPASVRSALLLGTGLVDPEEAPTDPIRSLRYGRLSAPVVVQDRVYVAEVPEMDDERRCYSAGGSRLMILDAEELVLVGTTTAPPCMTQLVASADGATLFGIHTSYPADDLRVDVSTFDLGGARRRTAPVDLAPATLCRGVWGATPAGEGIAIVVQCGDTAEESIVAFVDEDPRQQRSVFFENTTGIAIRTRADGRLLLFDGVAEATRILDPITGAEGEINYATDTCLGETIDLQVRFSALVGDHLLLSTVDRGHTAVLDVRDEGLGECRRACPFVAAADPTGFAIDPGDPTRAWVALVGRADRQARLARFDLEAGHLIPGVMALGGHGGLRGPVVDSAGRLWLSLPWEGRVLRVD